MVASGCGAARGSLLLGVAGRASGRTDLFIRHNGSACTLRDQAKQPVMPEAYANPEHIPSTVTPWVPPQELLQWLSLVSRRVIEQNNDWAA